MIKIRLKTLQKKEEICLRKKLRLMQSKIGLMALTLAGTYLFLINRNKNHLNLYPSQEKRNLKPSKTSCLILFYHSAERKTRLSPMR